MTHTVSRCGKTYDVTALWSIVASRAARPVNPTALHTDRSPRSGFGKRRYEAADLSYPIILWLDAPSERDRILDGRHRTAKACDIGLTTIDAVFVSSEELEQCLAPRVCL